MKSYIQCEDPDRTSELLLYSVAHFGVIKEALKCKLIRVALIKRMAVCLSTYGPH